MLTEDNKTKSEKIIELCATLTEKELRGVAELLCKRADTMKEQAANEAWKEMVAAWKKWRALCPTHYRWVYIETDDGGDLDFDLFEYMDDHIR